MDRPLEGFGFRDIEVGDGAELNVSGHTGDVTVQGDAEASIRIWIRGYDEDDFDGRDPLAITRDGDRVAIAFVDSGAQDLDLEIRAPCRSRAVSASATDGDVVVTGIEGAVAAQTVEGNATVVGARGTCAVTTTGGDITLREVQAICTVTTVDGDFSGSNLRGTLQATITNGDVEIVRSDLKSLTVSAVSSDLTIETPLTSGGSYRLSSTNGDVRLLVPPGTGATIRAKTMQGNVRTDLPVEIISSDRRNWQGVIGEGGADVFLESVNGELRIRHSSWSGMDSTERSPEPPRRPASVIPPIPPAPVAPPIPPIPPIPPMDFESDAADTPHFSVFADAPWVADTRSRVPETSGAPDTHEKTVALLARLERGEITVEEAMSGLDEVG